MLRPKIQDHYIIMIFLVKLKFFQQQKAQADALCTVDFSLRVLRNPCGTEDTGQCSFASVYLARMISDSGNGHSTPLVPFSSSLQNSTLQSSDLKYKLIIPKKGSSVNLNFFQEECRIFKIIHDDSGCPKQRQPLIVCQMANYDSVPEKSIVIPWDAAYKPNNVCCRSIAPNTNPGITREIALNRCLRLECRTN